MGKGKVGEVGKEGSGREGGTEAGRGGKEKARRAGEGGGGRNEVRKMLRCMYSLAWRTADFQHVFYSSIGSSEMHIRVTLKLCYTT